MRRLLHLLFISPISLVAALTIVTPAQDRPAQNDIKARELFYASGRNRPNPPAGNRATGAGPARGAATPAPLALRYKVLRWNGRSFDEVDADTDFSSGDQIRVSVSINDSASIYIAQFGSSGAWRVLFPPPDAPDRANVIGAYKEIEIPSADKAFQFDKTPGTERLFIAVSREPIADLERVIRNRNTQQPLQPSQPQQPPQAPSRERPNLLAADLPTPQFSATLVSDVLRTRDLTLVAFKADIPSGNSQEHAIYLANGADSKSPVVAEFKLKHRP